MSGSAAAADTVAVMILWAPAVYVAVAEPRLFNRLLLLALPAAIVLLLLSGGRQRHGHARGAVWARFLEKVRTAGRAAWEWAGRWRPWRPASNRGQDDCRRGGLRITARRLLARVFDSTLFGLLLMLLALGLGRWGFADGWFPVKLVLLAVPWLALWTALAGATPGKLLLRLRVRSVETGRVGLAAALRREWLCVRSGVGLAAATLGVWLGKSTLISLLGLPEVWDRRAGTRVVQLGGNEEGPAWLRWMGAWARAAVLAAAGWLFWLGLQPEPHALRRALEDAAGWLGRLPSLAKQLAV